MGLDQIYSEPKPNIGQNRPIETQTEILNNHQSTSMDLVVRVCIENMIALMRHIDG